jgi:hypothetical protein
MESGVGRIRWGRGASKLLQETGEWFGLVGDLVQDRADVVAAPLSFTHERNMYIDSMLPFYIEPVNYFVRWLFHPSR